MFGNIYSHTLIIINNNSTVPVLACSFLVVLFPSKFFMTYAVLAMLWCLSRVFVITSPSLPTTTTNDDNDDDNVDNDDDDTTNDDNNTTNASLTSPPPPPVTQQQLQQLHREEEGFFRCHLFLVCDSIFVCCE